MTPLPDPIRRAIAHWLETGEIDLFIGYERGSVPLRATPCFVRDAADVERLIWDAACENNLAVYLPKYRGIKVGLMAKGCDARAIVGLIQEGQVERENLRIVGVPCSGVVDARKVAARLGIVVEELEQGIVMPDGDVEIDGESIPADEALFDLCSTCNRRNPVVYDVLLGDSLPENDLPKDEFAHVRAMEALDDEARWEAFNAELTRCNLCYACRNACPLCYCNTCFADRTMPRWFNQTGDPEDLQFYQIMRTFHLAGRCVGCGACTRACPQGVNLRLFLDKLRLDARELFGYEAGTDVKARPPLTTYSPDDPDDFVL
ncbi:MAG TPA: 4Fe-4S ferredoxin [Chloroflexi bacterium]|jgi:formate dehydrogenase subunit beta|nr:4Fe-4S ferredoxin [Chloroflexota bacterium]